MYMQGNNVMFSSSGYASLMDWFHNFNCCLILGVLLFVSLIFWFLIYSKEVVLFTKNYQVAELLCGFFPIIVLIMQMLPSLSLLYYFGLMNFSSDLTIKVIGHQWYWSYDYSDMNYVSFDSYMKTMDTLLLGERRLLSVDNRCILPCSVSVCLCITSYDVIHSWTLFNFFIKLDAMCGILNVMHLSFPVVGVFYGQCSEICGANHSFMPIVLEVTLFNLFKHWCLSWVF